MSSAFLSLDSFFPSWPTILLPSLLVLLFPPFVSLFLASFLMPSSGSSSTSRSSTSDLISHSRKSTRRTRSPSRSDRDGRRSSFRFQPSCSSRTYPSTPLGRSVKIIPPGLSLRFFRFVALCWPLAPRHSKEDDSLRPPPPLLILQLVNSSLFLLNSFSQVRPHDRSEHGPPPIQGRNRLYIVPSHLHVYDLTSLRSAFAWARRTVAICLSILSAPTSSSSSATLLPSLSSR